MRIAINGFAYIENNGITKPFLVCQVCGEAIIDQRDNQSMIFWNDREGKENKAVVAHKNCMSKVKDGRSIYPSSEDLNSFFNSLLKNTEIEIGHKKISK
ncbi:MAG: hypothetical protein WC466_04070 [Candidatus Izemoplasmatales bacterium]